MFDALQEKCSYQTVFVRMFFLYYSTIKDLFSQLRVIIKNTP